jgi:peptidoglycan-associated lipoprotein
MRRLLTFGALSIFTLALVISCGGKKPIAEETPPPPPPVVTQQDTTPPPPPPPPPPPATLKVEQLLTVYFDFDKFNLRSDARASLDKDVALLKEFPDAIIKLEGHCDERGTVEYNIALGEKRADAVATYLVNNGIAANRISTISYGKERPVDPNHTEDAWAKNRRVEFKIISQ